MEEYTHLSYSKTDTDYWRRNIINVIIKGCWIWDIVHWLSHKKPMFWVSDNTSKQHKTVQDCVRLWCHGVRIVGAYCDVTVWELCNDIVMSWSEIWVISLLWCHCEVNVMFQFEVIVSWCCDLSMRFLWDHCDAMVTSNCWVCWVRRHAACRIWAKIFIRTRVRVNVNPI